MIAMTKISKGCFDSNFSRTKGSFAEGVEHPRNMFLDQLAALMANLIGPGFGCRILYFRSHS